MASVAGFVSALDLSVMFVAFPEIRDAFPEASTALLSWVVTTYSIVVAALLIPSGRLADRLGRRRIFLVGVGLFGLGSLLSGLAVHPAMLIMTRAFQAAGGALLTPAALALLMQEFPVSRRAMAIGAWGAVGGLAAASGPAIGSAVIEAGGWRWAFFMNVPLAALSFFCGWRLFTESRQPGTRITDPLGSALVMLAVASLAYGIVQGPERGWTDPAVIGAFVVSAVGAFTLIRRSQRHPEPVLPLHLFADRGFVCANLVAVLFSVAFFAMFFGLVLFVNEAWAEPTGRAGLLITPALLTAAVCSFLGGRRADRVGHRLVMIPGSLAFSAGAVLLALGVGEEPELWLWVPALVLLGVGIGAVFPSFQSGAVHRVSSGEFAVAAATVQTNSRIAGTLGVAIAVVLVGTYVTGDPVEEFDRLWLLLAALGGAAAVVSFGVDTRQPTATTPATLD